MRNVILEMRTGCIYIKNQKKNKCLTKKDSKMTLHAAKSLLMDRNVVTKKTTLPWLRKAKK